MYDALGNLTRVGLAAGDSISYLIDGRNRRIGKRVNGTLTKGWLYQSRLAPIAELDGSGTVVSKFVYATRANVPDYMVRGDSTYRLVLDHLGSVRLVVNTQTGNVAQRLEYDEFGRVTTNTSPGFQPFGYAGGMYDELTGLVRFGARDYDAGSGRWTAKDPAGFLGRSTNLFAYVRSDPINLVDRTGLAPGDNWYGLDRRPGGRTFTDWVHRQVKPYCDMDADDNFSKEQLEQLWEDWVQEGRPDGAGHRTVPETPPQPEDNSAANRRSDRSTVPGIPPLTQSQQNNVRNAGIVGALGGIMIFAVEYGWIILL